MPVVAIVLGILCAALLLSVEAIAGFLRLGKAYAWLFELSLGGLLGYLVYALARTQSRLRALESGALKPAAVSPPARPSAAPAAAAPASPATVTRPPAAVVAATPVSTPVAAAPAEPPRWWTATREFLFGGNTAVRIGVVVLFFGVAFLLKYAADRNLFPVELRLTTAALGGLVLLVFGWRLRLRLPGYALALQGGAVGILYLTVFAALRLYHLIPPALAFGLLALVAVFSAVLAVAQNARSLAVLGAAGGFLAPVLASTGAGQHVLLFSYYALLNAGILAIAWFRAWRSLNLLGFVFTFVIGALWGRKYYQPDLFASTEPFLILFTLMYIGIAVLYALRQPLKLTGLVDGTLVFGVPLIGFTLQAVLLRPYEFGLAWSALALGGLYLSLAMLLWRRLAEKSRLLTESFLALGIGFATLAVPLAFDGRWTAAAWALEGAALLWVGVRQQQRLARWAGALLILASGFFYLHDATTNPSALLTPVLNGHYLGGALIAIAALFGSWTLNRHRERLGSLDKVIAVMLFVWGLLWWLGSGSDEIERHLIRATRAAANVGLVALTVVLLELLGRRFRWAMASRVAPWGIVAMFPLLLAFSLLRVSHPLADYGYLAWPAAFAIHFWVLRRGETQRPAGLGVAHAIGWWWLALIAALELHWQIDHQVAAAGTWSAIAWALVPTALLLWTGSAPSQRLWPWRTQPAYLTLGSAPIAVALALWVFMAALSLRGSAWPLPYVPLLNPLDVALAFALFALSAWLLRLQRHHPGSADSRRVVTIGLALLAFLWLNSALVRAFHHLAGVPFEFEAILRSQLVQAGFSVFWSVLALATMVLATRRGWRAVWIAGAVLLGVVVVKLFLVDLAKTATLARVVSFLSVGVLLLIVGYLSPVPPRRAKESV
ncbi:MAG: DUF2339 domain-containing protein [Pseudomonadota bacterium]